MPTSISALTLCVLSDPRTAAASTDSTKANPFAGVAGTEKISTSNATELGLYTTGVFVFTAAGSAIVAGELVALSGANLIAPAVALDLLSGAIIGKAWEDIAAAGTGEVHVGVLV